MNTTKEFNLQDWSGESVKVDYSDDGAFKYYGYDFTLGDYVGLCADHPEWGGVRLLHSPDWEDHLTGIKAANETDLEGAVVSAVRWIAKYV